MSSSLTAEAAAELQQGITLLLGRWAALRMAVENEWGGRDSLQKSEELAHQLFYRLTQSKEQVYIDDLEEMLDEFMLSLNTEIDDGSIEEIAEKLMFMREECLEGNFDSIKRLKETNAPSVSYAKQPAGDDEEESDDNDGGYDHLEEDKSSEMEVDRSEYQPSLDQKDTIPEVLDGWTVVSSRRGRGRKT